MLTARRLRAAWPGSIPTAIWIPHLPTAVAWWAKEVVSGLLIQTDGKIVAIGGLDGDLAVARYLAN